MDMVSRWRADALPVRELEADVDASVNETEYRLLSAATVP